MKYLILILSFLSMETISAITSREEGFTCGDAVTMYRQVKHRLTLVSEADIQEIYSLAIEMGANLAEVRAVLQSAQLLTHRRGVFQALGHLAHQRKMERGRLTPEDAAALVERVFGGSSPEERQLVMDRLEKLAAREGTCDGDELRSMIEDRIYERLLDVGIPTPMVLEEEKDPKESIETPSDDAEIPLAVTESAEEREASREWLESLVSQSIRPKAFRTFLNELERRKPSDRHLIIKALEDLAKTGDSRVADKIRHSEEVYELHPKGTKVRVLFARENGVVRIILGELNPKAGSDRGGLRERMIFAHADQMWRQRQSTSGVK